MLTSKQVDQKSRKHVFQHLNVKLELFICTAMLDFIVEKSGWNWKKHNWPDNKDKFGRLGKDYKITIKRDFHLLNVETGFGYSLPFCGWQQQLLKCRSHITENWWIRCLRWEKIARNNKEQKKIAACSAPLIF